MFGPTNMTAPFESLGVVLGESSGEGNVKGDCPFCGKPDHFTVNPRTGLWDCKRCGLSGNVPKFLTYLAQQTSKETHSRDWDRLEKSRGIPAEAFKRLSFGWDGEQWLIPTWGGNGYVVGMHKWRSWRPISVSGVGLHLYGYEEISKAPKGTIVWICEGHWDRVALRWVLDECGRTQEKVVAVPGANTFKKEWASYFMGMRVRLAYDNDSSGDAGSRKASDIIRQFAQEIQFLNWPEQKPNKWDIREHVKFGLFQKWPAGRIMQDLDALLEKKHRRDKPAPSSRPSFSDSIDGDQPEVIPFSKVLEVFRKWVRVDLDFEAALAVSLATCLGNEMVGDPIWIYIVGPPGGGKTLILTSLKNSDRVSFFSSLTAKSLISGYVGNKDPSILPALDKKTAVFKDGTELLAMHPDARREAYGVLRGAFDGHVHRAFGNGVVRDYKSKFNMLIGVTPAVQGDIQSSMGDRFLKFAMHENPLTLEDKIRVAMQNISKEVQMEQELSEVVTQFLNRKIDPETLPPLGPLEKRVIPISQVVSKLRAQCDRETFGDRELKYRPFSEVGTRIAKQISKLARLLCYVYGRPMPDHKIVWLVERVALDTCIAFHLDIVKAFPPGDGPKDVTKDQIGRATHIPSQTLGRKLTDMEQLGVLQKTPSAPSKGVGLSLTARWRLDETFRELWVRSGLLHRPKKAGLAASPPRKR